MAFAQKQKQLRRAAGSSGAIYHVENRKREELDRRMTGLSNKTDEASERMDFREKNLKENSYGRISIGANRKDEIGLVVSGKQQFHGSLARENEQELILDRSKRQDKNQFGEVRTNTLDEKNSAVGLFSNKEITENQMLSRLREFEQSNDNQQAARQLPFLRLEQERQKKEGLTRQWQQAKDLKDEKEKQRLQRESLWQERWINRLEHQERMFRQQLQEQLQELREHPQKDKKEIPLLSRLIRQVIEAQEDETDTPDEPAAEQEDV